MLAEWTSVISHVQDALAEPSSANWAAPVVEHVQSLGLPASFAHDGTVSLTRPGPVFVAMLLADLMRSGRACMLTLGLRPPKGPSCACVIAGSCASIGPVAETYCQLPLSDRCMRRLLCLRLGAHTLPIEMGRRLRMPGVAPIWPLCPGMQHACG